MRNGKSFTIKEVALIFEDLANLVDPNLAHSRVGREEDVVLHAAVGRPGCEGKLTRVSIHAVLQTQATDLWVQIRGSLEEKEEVGKYAVWEL